MEELIFGATGFASREYVEMLLFVKQIIMYLITGSQKGSSNFFFFKNKIYGFCHQNVLKLEAVRLISLASDGTSLKYMKQGLKTDKYIFRELPPTSHSLIPHSRISF